MGAIFAKDNRDGRVFAREVPSDMAAARAGLLVDDELVAVDGHPVQRMAIDELHQALAGKVGTVVQLQVRRGDRLIVLPVERGPLKGTKPGG